MTASTPPPLKRASPRARDGLPPPPGALELSLPAVDELPASEGDADLGDPAKGEWVFKQGDVLLGPVAASVILKRIDQGELDVDTPIGREAGRWRPLGEVPFFAERSLAVAERRRREAARRVAEAQQRRARAARWVGVVVIALVPFVAGALLGHTLAERRPWDDTEEWLQRAPPLVDLPARPVVAPPAAPARPAPSPLESPSPPEVAAAPAQGDEPPAKDRRKARQKGKKQKRAKKVRKGKETLAARADEREPVAAAPAAVRAEKQAPAARGPKVVETLTTAQVMAGLSSGKAGIGRCLKAESARNPDMPGVVTLMFTVTEEGKATNVKLKEREVREGPLASCLVGVVSKLRWPRFTGERKNAEVPFRIKR